MTKNPKKQKGVLIKVRVVCNSRKVTIEKLSEENYKVKLTSPPEKGKANVQLLKVLAKYFEISKQDVGIIRGLKSNLKLISLISK